MTARAVPLARMMLSHVAVTASFGGEPGDIEVSHALAAPQIFERLVADLSGRFINAAPDEIDAAIVEALARVSALVGADRAALCEIDPAGALIDIVRWHAPAVTDSTLRWSQMQRFPWTLSRALAGEPVAIAAVDQIPSEVDRVSYAANDSRSAAVLPLFVGGRVAGLLACESVLNAQPWALDARHRLRVLATVFAHVLDRRRREVAVRHAEDELARLTPDVARTAPARRDAHAPLANTPIVGKSAAIRQAIDQLQQVAATDATVLLVGETGTGKGLFATQIHELSARRRKAMIAVSCAAIPSTLIESELFGRERGAFTGATTRQLGRFELADEGTIFLDEIGDLPAVVQVKLLRVLESGQIERLGSPHPVSVNCRIIAATHVDLDRHVRDGRFRDDLLYRLNVFPIGVPALRDRSEDIPLLVWHFIEELAPALGKRIERVSPASLTALQQYSWPGNIRELRNVVERAIIGSPGPELEIAAPAVSAAAARRSLRLEDVERGHILDVLESTGWRVRGRDGAADLLGMKPTTLESRMAKLGIRRPRPASTST